MSRLIFGYHIAIIFMTDINQPMAAIRKSVSRTGGIKPLIMPTINVTPWKLTSFGQTPAAYMQMINASTVKLRYK